MLLADTQATFQFIKIDEYPPARDVSGAYLPIVPTRNRETLTIQVSVGNERLFVPFHSNDRHSGAPPSAQWYPVPSAMSSIKVKKP